MYNKKQTQKSLFFNESAYKPSSVESNHLSRRRITPNAPAIFRNTSGKCMVSVDVAPDRVYMAVVSPPRR